jgi:hypothetical protein
MMDIALTDRGRQIMDERDCLIRRGVKEKLSCLTEEEMHELSVSLRTLRDILAKLQ